MEGEVIVLAAGRGERAGRPKALIAVQGAPWLERQLERLAECGLARAIVVLGHDLPAHVAAMPWVERALVAPLPLVGLRVEVVWNGAPERGPFSSLACGLARASGDATFVLPVDVPCPGRAVWQALDAAATLAAVPDRDGRGGHPVRVSRAFASRLLAVPFDSPVARLDAQLRMLAAGELTRVPVDDVRAFTNLNTPEDWESIAGGAGVDDR
jgi:molybdenum cofactor cytidylyltransferase